MRLDLDRYQGMPDRVREQFDEWLAKNLDGLNVVSITIGAEIQPSTIGASTRGWHCTVEVATGNVIGRGKTRRFERETRGATVAEYPPECSWRYFRTEERS